MQSLLEDYKSIFIVTVDNVSSQQMHEIRQSLRGEGVVLMGKNTMVRLLYSGPASFPGNPFALAAPRLRTQRLQHRESCIMDSI